MSGAFRDRWSSAEWGRCWTGWSILREVIESLRYTLGGQVQSLMADRRKRLRAGSRL